MAMGFNLQPMWMAPGQRPNRLLHVNDLELAHIDTVLERGIRVTGAFEDDGGDEERIRHLISRILSVAGIDAAKHYAFLKTGFLATVENIASFTEEELRWWEESIAEYESLHSGTA